MLKVLMCGNHPSNKGGMTSVINQILAKNWNSDEIEISFIPTYMPGGKLRTIVFFAFSYVRVLVRFLLKKPDVLYTHMSVRGSFTRTKALQRLCAKFRVPDVIHLHGSEFRDWYESETEERKKKIQALIQECKAFIVLGKKWETYVSEIAPKANIIQIHNCIDIPQNTASWGDPQTYLFLGVLIPRKGVLDLLKAIRILANQKQIDRCVFNIGGTGDEESTLRQYVQQNSLEKYVRFLGWVTGEDKNILLSKSNVFILPSYNEGLPVSILEAMSYGLPIISTRVGDIEDAVSEGENGYLISPGDTEALADRILRMKNRDTWQRLSEASRLKAEQQFDIIQFYRHLALVWKSVAE